MISMSIVHLLTSRTTWYTPCIMLSTVNSRLTRATRNTKRSRSYDHTPIPCHEYDYCTVGYDLYATPIHQMTHWMIQYVITQNPTHHMMLFIITSTVGWRAPVWSQSHWCRLIVCAYSNYMLIQGFSQYTYLVTRIDDHSKNFCAGVTSSLCCGTLMSHNMVIPHQNPAHARTENFGGLLATLCCVGISVGKICFDFNDLLCRLTFYQYVVL